MKLKNSHLLVIGIILLFLVNISTQFYGNADIGDYVDVAKFFAGDYKAKIRSSHSYFYGFMLSPFTKLTENFLAMKIMSLIWLVLLILSIYYISNKNRTTLLLTITAPIFWYMAPTIGPLPVSSLFFLWGYYFLREYDSNEKLKNLFYSGIFFGLAWVFWDTILHFGILLTLIFFWKRKLSHFFYFIIFILIGLLPRLILDQILFNFPFYTIIKSFSGGIVNSLWSGTLGSGHSPKTFANIFSTLIILPLFLWLFLKKENFKQNKKTILFLILGLLLIFSNPQTRYTLIPIPIILLHLGKMINKKQLKIYLIFSIILSILVISPYLIQINHSTNSQEFNAFISNLKNIKIYDENPENLIKQDLISLEKDFSNEVFVVGPLSDDYAILARLYGRNQIKEFISIQDYNLWLNNETILFEKEFHPIPEINNRREIWIKGGISKRINDNTNYEKINYAIALNEPLNLENFKLLKRYNLLSLYQKTDILNS